ncbi:Man1-Src1p-C-terminal domain-containing protein [Xylariaceae sp. FL0804]|nr:Man1-Src1p-C-terminal domain-containing protein [Xylariaceae sp. FL0804]
MSDQESEYLQPGFDPKTLTIPRLRSVLVAHNVSYTSTAKKAQLVELFNDQVAPQAKKILAARAKAKRSSKGIVDADSQSSSNPFDEHEELAPPAARTRRSRSPRKASAKIKSEEPEDGPPMPPPVPSPSKRKSRATSRQLRASDTETGSEMDGSTALKRTRQAAGTPKLKSEETDGLFRRTSDVFTADNPFQSGSSPPVAEKPASTRRRTTGHEKSRSASRNLRKQIDSPPDSPTLENDDAAFGEPADYETPVNQLTRTKTSESPIPALEVEAGEEFTPEEQLEIAAEEAVNGENAVMPARRRRQPNERGWGKLLLGLLVTLGGVGGAWYRQEKVAVGYCGVGRYGSSIPSEIEVPEWAHPVLPAQIEIPRSVIDTLEPDCEPCPAHANCYADFSVRCEQDYILKPHPLSFGGIFPLPPTCEPDGARVRRVRAVADRAVEELRERTANYECGNEDKQGEKVTTPAIEEQELKQIINSKRSKKMSNQEFEELWGSAIGEVKDREEVKVEIKEASDSAAVPDSYLSSTSLARVSIGCSIKRSIWLGLARHRLPISIVIVLMFAAVYARAWFLSDRAARTQVPALVDLVLERLANQKQLGDEDVDDAYLFLPNLRDDVLRSVHSLPEREKIWRRVRAVVEQNSNVRTGQREGRSGEVGRAWEWIGPSAAADGARRRKSGRVSWGADGKGEDSPAAASSEDKSHLHQKWEESRPVY